MWKSRIGRMKAGLVGKLESLWPAICRVLKKVARAYQIGLASHVMPEGWYIASQVKVETELGTPIQDKMLAEDVKAFNAYLGSEENGSWDRVDCDSVPSEDRFPSGALKGMPEGKK